MFQLDSIGCTTEYLIWEEFKKIQTLISKTELRETGYRVVQVVADDQVFPVSDDLFWSPCDISVIADQFWYDPTDEKIKPFLPITHSIYEYVIVNSNNNNVTLVVSGTYTNVMVVDQPLHGVTTSTNSEIFYTPDIDYVGTDTFTYSATNISGNSNTSTIHIVVTTSMNAGITQP